jgi:hypothetical protein
MVKYIAAYVISTTLFCWFFYGYGVDKGNLKVAIVKKEITEEYNKQLKDQIDRTQTLQKELTLVKLNKENEIYSINKRHSATINSLRNRPERTITITQDRSTPIDSPREGSSGEQLFREDAEFLIGEAAKAEILKQSLLACRRNLIGNNND